MAPPRRVGRIRQQWVVLPDVDRPRTRQCFAVGGESGNVCGVGSSDRCSNWLKMVSACDHAISRREEPANQGIAACISSLSVTMAAEIGSQSQHAAD